MEEGEFLLGIMRHTILFLAATLIPGYVLAIKRKYLFYITLTILFLLIVSTFFPLFTINNMNYSLWNYINSGNTYYLIMFFGYLAPMLVIVTKNKKIVTIAGYIFLLGFIMAYGGLFSLGDELMSHALNQNRWATVSWLLLNYVVPLITLIFYIPYTHKLIKEE